MLDLHKRREIETVLEDLEQALTQLRTTLKAAKLDSVKISSHATSGSSRTQCAHQIRWLSENNAITT